MPNWLLLFAAIYIVSGILAYGFTLAYYQREFSDAQKRLQEDKQCALVVAAFGPIGLLAFVLAARTLKHGLMFRTGGKK